MERIKFILKQMLYHGRNLGMFVGIYKSVSNRMEGEEKDDEKGRKERESREKR